MTLVFAQSERLISWRPCVRQEHRGARRQGQYYSPSNAYADTGYRAGHLLRNSAWITANQTAHCVQSLPVQILESESIELEALLSDPRMHVTDCAEHPTAPGTADCGSRKVRSMVMS
ncbi:unnamed protein product [Cercospora beticola]|nr:unnamed protein product [Cercospora beticola]